MQLPPDWSEFLSLLSRHRVKFLLIGAHALAAHGHPRATLDLDVFVEASPANARRIGRALAEFGFDTAADQAVHLATADRMMRLGREPLRIDILNQISGVSWAAAWKGRMAATLDNHRVFVIGRAELRRNKRASGRPKDVADLAVLDDAPATRAAGRSRRTRRRPAATSSRTPGTRRR